MPILFGTLFAFVDFMASNNNFKISDMLGHDLLQQPAISAQHKPLPRSGCGAALKLISR